MFDCLTPAAPKGSASPPRRWPGLLLALLLVLGAASACRAQSQSKAARTDDSKTATNQSGRPMPPEQGAYDVTFYDLAVRVFPKKKRIAGTLTARVDVVHPLGWFVQDLDARMKVQRVELVRAGGKTASLHYERRGGRLWTRLERTRQPGETLAVRVQYAGTPRVAPNPPWDGGFTWAQTPGGQPWVASSVQEEGADLWWPTKDQPSDEADSVALHFTVPRPLVAASNGRPRGVTAHGDGTRTYDWFVSTPINNYDVALNAAPYRTITDIYESVDGTDIPVTFWVLASDYEKGKMLFPQFAKDLRFYEETLGPYPFRADKFGVAETPFLGMEHQTIIAYGSDFTDNAAGYDYLLHHEMGHEWWGNLVTAPDWSEFWIHEGLCEYMQALYAEKLGGPAAYRASMADARAKIQNDHPIAPRGHRTTKQMYTSNDIYYKGQWVLHTLRYLIGDAAFFKVLRRMAYPTPALRRATDGRQCRFATTQDLKRIAEAVSGRSLDRFFEVYVRQTALPRLVTERDGDVLRLRWKTPDGQPFALPVPVRVGATTRRVSMKDGTAQVRLPGASANVTVDPNHQVLKAG